MLLVVFLILLAAGGGWFAARKYPPGAAVSVSEGDQKPLFYQSPMHPWIKSDQPGDCTICGMKLVPVYDSSAAVPGSEGLVTLSEQSINVLHVADAPVVRQPLSRSLQVAGRIEDDDATHRRLSATVEGRIEKLYVDSVGAEVTKDQPLLAFFSRELLVARGEYSLALKQPVASERETALVGIRAKLRRMGLASEQIEGLAGQTGDTIELLAPISGTVVERKVYEGQYVKEGDVLFEIGDFSRMWFVADVYERDLAWIKIGQEVEITTPTVPGKVYRAPITFIDPNVMENTRTARIRVVLENPLVGDEGKHRRELLHRIFASGVVRIEIPETLTVPRSAVLATGVRPLVYVVKSAGVFEPRQVQLGRVGDDFYEVLGGLAENERVVTQGNLLIDAQAQLDRGSTGLGETANLVTRAEPPDVAPAGATTDSPESAQALFAFGDRLAARLATDDLAGFNATLKKCAFQ